MAETAQQQGRARRGRQVRGAAPRRARPSAALRAALALAMALTASALLPIVPPVVSPAVAQAVVPAVVPSDLPGAGAEGGFSALARLDAAASLIETAPGGGLRLSLRLSQPVPYALRLLDGPPRLVIDTRQVDWRGAAGLATGAGPALVALRSGVIAPGWTRLVLELAGPMRLGPSALRTGGAAGADLVLALAPADAQGFAGAVAAQPAPPWALPRPLPAGPPVKRRQTGDGPLIVVLDPGHGGIDPGAEAGGTVEAAMMLTFARELKEALLRAGGVNVVLTREDDVFVPLEVRTSVARAAGADVLVSLHADALDEGVATGATIYTLADEASDAASARLAERHDREDLLAGVDLTGADEAVVDVLMDLARAETQPRAESLADTLVGTITEATGPMYKRPRLTADFSVLKSPDIPSVLIELGYLSSDRDRARLADAGWRGQMVQGIVAGLQDWAVTDAAAAALVRQ